jgi:hypothetical protein
MDGGRSTCFYGADMSLSLYQAKPAQFRPEPPSPAGMTLQSDLLARYCRYETYLSQINDKSPLGVDKC